MSARPIAMAPVALLLCLLVIGAAPNLAQASPGYASAPTSWTAAVCQPAPERDDDTIHITGCLKDLRETPPTAVPGVDLSVEDSSGDTVGTGTSDASGTFDIPLPGDAIDNLGKTFTVHIDVDTLPEGAALQDSKQVSLKITPRLDSDVFVTFPIGDAPAKGPGKATQALQLAVGGLVFALLLAMASLALSLIFGTTGLTNFAHGELITFGALVAFGVDSLPGNISVGGVNITILVAALVATVASGLFGLLNDRGLWLPLRRRGTGLTALMVVSIGLSILLRSVYQYIIGGNAHQYSQYAVQEPFKVGPLLITERDVAVAIFAIAVLGGVVTAMKTTRLGKAARAIADNPALAASTGINVDRVITAVWIGGAALAGLSGVLLGLTQGFDFQLGLKMLLLVFAATVLGGLGTIWGPIVGALTLGTLVEVSTLFVPTELKYVGALVVLIIVLLIRPQGLLGRAQRVG
ncbi:MAG TPA: branched-chain amino acid ABC transporter permease [Actinomycetes bacterium]|nr:branched-chain amino acid ABC transporter permease [Actinomycetes bacterium]